MAVLEAQSLGGGYGDSNVLENICLSVTSGRWTGIVGPNGSGKTTLLRMLCRTLRPSTGRVTLDGADIYEDRQQSVARRIAVVPQSLSLEFAFTVAEFVEMGRFPHLGRFGRSGANDRRVVLDCLGRTGVSRLAGRVVTELSGGEMQRVLIAQALAQAPEVLLLDEPTHHLDINHQLEVMDLVADLRRGGLAVTAVLHDLNLAAYYCDELVMLKDGRLAARGRPSEVLTSSNVRNIFDAEAVVHRHPITGRMSVTALPRSGGELREGDGDRVHVICGSGTGLSVIRGLRERGFTVSVGVVNALDSDYELAESLGLAVVAEAPFSSISDGALEENARQVEGCRAVVVASTPFGPANLANLGTGLTALRKGVKVYLIEETPAEERDFTGGAALALRDELVEKGATVVSDEVGLWRALVSGMEARAPDVAGEVAAAAYSVESGGRQED